MCKVFVEIRTTPIVGAGLRGMPKGIRTVDLVPAVAWHVLRSGGAQGTRPTVETPRNHCKLNLCNQIFTHPMYNITLNLE